MNEQQAQELLSFQIYYSQRKIRATWALGFVIAVMFLCEELLGGSTTVSVLIKLGANVRELVQDGQYFRLLTSVFLHAGWIHVFVNVYVLFALGGFFNRILGDSKYLVIFFVSGITGSLASFLLGTSSVSVGASGALWGLFGASIVIAFFRTHLIPEILRVRLRRITLINLIINLGVSFLPMVDLWAHVGGGIGGFLISLLYIKEPHAPSSRLLLTRIFAFTAGFLTLVYTAGFVQMLIIDKPWQKRISSPLVEVEFYNIPIILSLPKDLKEKPGPDNSPSNSSFLFGDLRFEPIAIEVSFISATIMSDKKSWLKQQRDLLLRDPKIGPEIRKSVDLRQEGSRQVLFFETPTKADIIGYNYVMLFNDYVVKLVFITSKKTSQSEVEVLAKKILASIKSPLTAHP